MEEQSNKISIIESAEIFLPEYLQNLAQFLWYSAVGYHVNWYAYTDHSEVYTTPISVPKAVLTYHRYHTITAQQTTVQLLSLTLCKGLATSLPLGKWNWQKLSREKYCRQNITGLKRKFYWSCNTGKTNTSNQTYYRKCMAEEKREHYFFTFVYFKKYSVKRRI
jgi:hypothetical protein